MAKERITGERIEQLAARLEKALDGLEKANGDLYLGRQQSGIDRIDKAIADVTDVVADLYKMSYDAGFVSVIRR